MALWWALAALGPAAAWSAWLGWDDGYQVDPATGGVGAILVLIGTALGTVAVAGVTAGIRAAVRPRPQPPTRSV